MGLIVVTRGRGDSDMWKSNTLCLSRRERQVTFRIPIEDVRVQLGWTTVNNKECRVRFTFCAGPAVGKALIEKTNWRPSHKCTFDSLGFMQFIKSVRPLEDAQRLCPEQRLKYWVPFTVIPVGENKERQNFIVFSLPQPAVDVATADRELPDEMPAVDETAIEAENYPAEEVQLGQTQGQ